jgi:hypothetical protein
MTDDEVLDLLSKGNRARDTARTTFEEAHREAESEVAKCWTAHMLGVVSDDPHEKLHWNLESLRAAGAASGDGRAPSLLPTVLANIGYSTLLVARPAEARLWYERALESLADARLPDDRRGNYRLAIEGMIATIDEAID